MEAKVFLEVLVKKLRLLTLICLIEAQEPNPLLYEEGDWVTYIDSEGKEHIREHLNIQLDFKPVMNDTFNKMFDFAANKMPTTRNSRIFEVAKELVLKFQYNAAEAVGKAIELVDKVGIETFRYEQLDRN